MAVLLVCDRCGLTEADGVRYVLEARSISGRAVIPLLDREEVHLCDGCVADAARAVAAWLEPKEAKK